VKTLRAVQRAHILDVLAQVQWKIEGYNNAAWILGLKPSTLRSLMARLQITRVKP
jgi:transcriptional regulator with GAF, ATPase, and Fis domain